MTERLKRKHGGVNYELINVNQKYKGEGNVCSGCVFEHNSRLCGAVNDFDCLTGKDRMVWRKVK